MLNLNCVICTEIFSHTDDVHVTTCGHMFHLLCLQQWMERSKSCPQCRSRCTDRNVIKLYFNLANLDVSRIDVGSLQEQLDNANLQLVTMQRNINTAEEQIKLLKEIQKKCMKTISGLEQKLQQNDFVILNYTEQVKMLKTDAKLVEDLRKEIKRLNELMETMEGVNALIKGTSSDAEKLLKSENNPKKLSVWVTTLKRELRLCESKKTDLRNVLRVVQNDLRKEIEIKKVHEERISQLESDHYQLNEKIKSLEAINAKQASIKTELPSSRVNSGLMSLCRCMREDKRLTISPSVKDNIKKIEESDSPYLNIKSSSIGLLPLYKRSNDTQPGDMLTKTTTKVATLKISPKKNGTGSSTSFGPGIVRKTASDLSEKYSILKKPRLGLTYSASSANIMKPNFVFNGFGGSDKVDPYARESDEYEEESLRRARKLAAADDEGKALKSTALTSSLSNRLKAGGLRNFKISK